MHCSETRFFAQFRATGDPDALAKVYDLTYARLMGAARRWAPDRTAAEDLLHQTFVIAIERADRYTPGRPVVAWLLAILHNEARRARRAGMRQGWQPLTEVDLGVAVENPFRRATQREQAAELSRAIEGLPEPYRGPIHLRLLRGWSHEAIAAKLGRSAGTVRMQTLRGLRLLRRSLSGGALCALLAQAVFAAPGRAAAPREAPPRGSRRVLRVSAAVGAGAVAGAMAWTAVWSLAAGGRPAASESVRQPMQSAVLADRGRQVPTLSAPRRRVSPAVAPNPTPALVVQLQPSTNQAAGRRWLRLRPLATAHPDLFERWVESDTGGCAVVPALQCGPWQVTAARGGEHASVTISPRGSSTLTIPVTSGYSVAGVVLDERGERVAHPSIWLSDAENERDGHVACVGDAAGEFRLEGVSGVRYLGARARGCAAGPLAPVAARHGDVVRVRLEVSRAHGRVAGLVLGSGQPIAGARIRCGPTADLRGVVLADGRSGLQAPPLVVHSDRWGRFEVDGVPVGRTSLVCQAEGRLGEVVPVSVAEGAVTRCTLDLRAAEITGRVIDEGGDPVAGALIRGACRGGAEGMGVRSAADGGYVIRTVPHRYIALHAVHPAFGQATQALRLDAAGGPVAWNPVLRPGPLPIRGVLTGPDGGPLAGWTVQVRGGGAGPLAGPDSATTDRRGRFALARSSGAAQALVVLPPETPCPCGPPIPVDAGCGVQDVRLPSSTMPTAEVRGRIAGPHGLPVAGLRASLTRARWVTREHLIDDHLWLPVDPDGAFRRDRLPPGEYTIRAIAPDGAATVTRTVRLTADELADLGTLLLAPSS